MSPTTWLRASLALPVVTGPVVGPFHREAGGLLMASLVVSGPAYVVVVLWLWRRFGRLRRDAEAWRLLATAPIAHAVLVGLWFAVRLVVGGGQAFVDAWQAAVSVVVLAAGLSYAFAAAIAAVLLTGRAMGLVDARWPGRE